MDEAPEPNPTPRPRRNMLVVAAVALVAVVAAAALVITTTGGDADEEADSCLADLARMVPAVTGVEASDLRAARRSGYDDSSVETMIETALELSISPDPVTRQLVMIRAETDIDGMPYAPSDVDCWILSGQHFVISGNFDRERFEDADERFGDMAVLSEDDQLVVSDEALLAEVDEDAQAGMSPLLAEAVEALGPGVVYSRLIPGTVGGEEGGAWTGSSLAADGSRWSITTVWAYDDPAVAEEAEPQLRELLQDESNLYHQIMVGNPGSDLTREGGVLRTRSRLAGEIRDWYSMLNQFDPVILFDPRS